MNDGQAIGLSFQLLAILLAVSVGVEEEGVKILIVATWFIGFIIMALASEARRK